MHQNQFQGLSQAQVEERRQKGLTNQITISTERTTWQIVRSNISPILILFFLYWPFSWS